MTREINPNFNHKIMFLYLVIGAVIAGYMGHWYLGQMIDTLPSYRLLIIVGAVLFGGFAGCVLYSLRLLHKSSPT